MSTQQERASLRKLAKAATSGEWKWVEGTPIITRQWNGKDCAIAVVDYKNLAWHEDGNCAGRESGANAAHIAAANPAKTLELLDDLDHQEAEIARLTAERDSYKADAERYRWLRSGKYSIRFARSVLNDTPIGIDAAISAAMKGQP